MADTPTVYPGTGPRDPTAVFPVHDPTASFSFATEEEKVLEYWRDIDAFGESLRQSEGKETFSFYDGMSHCHCSVG